MELKAEVFFPDADMQHALVPCHFSGGVLTRQLLDLILLPGMLLSKAQLWIYTCSVLAELTTSHSVTLSLVFVASTILSFSLVLTSLSA